MINRFRTFIVSATLSSILAPCFASQAQTIGILEYGTPAVFAPLLTAFKEGLREGGFVEGQNLTIDQRFADYDRHRIERLAKELVAAKVRVIFAPTPWAVHGAKAATKTIPIVFSGVNDPVGVKFVKSLARPGGNITGISVVSNELTAKRIELMHDLFPAATRIGVVYDKDAARACQIELKDMARASSHLRIDVRVYPYDSPAEVRDAFKTSQKANVAAVLIPTTMEARRAGDELVSVSAASRIPTMHASRVSVEAGGLISYGPDNNWAYRRAGNYVARILKGTKPEELPVELPTTYELAINLKTARAMGIKIPDSVLLRATHLVQ
jgi:putative ABC transport system substrate-binding protein